MENVVVIDGQVRLKNVIDGNAYPVLLSSGGSGGTRDYEKLINRPRIEDVEVIGNKTFEDYGLSELTGDELIAILTD